MDKIHDVRQRYLHQAEVSRTQASSSKACDKYDQRVGGLIVIVDLAREMGVDLAAILQRAGLDSHTLENVDNRIPFASMGRLLNECGLATGCPHFSLLTCERVRLSHFGLPGELMRYSATLRAGLQACVSYQHLNSQGMVTFLFEDGAIASLGCAVL